LTEFLANRRFDNTGLSLRRDLVFLWSHYLSLFLLLIPFATFGQYAVPGGFFKISCLWPIENGKAQYLSTVLSRRDIEITHEGEYSFAVSGKYSFGKYYSLGFSGDIRDDRFFTDYYSSLWFGRRFGRRLNVAVAGDITGYGYSPEDANIEDSDDPIATTSRSVIKPSLSVGFGLLPADDLTLAATIKNILQPNIGVGDVHECRQPMIISAGVSWRLGDYIPFADIDIETGDETNIAAKGGVTARLSRSSLFLTACGGNRGIFAGVGYDFGSLTLGYGLEKPIGEAANIADLTHSVYLEFTQKRKHVAKPELPDTINYICPPNPMPARWMKISKSSDIDYRLDLFCGEFDSVLFYFSPFRKIPMWNPGEPGLWRVELSEFPGPNSWITGYSGTEGFCLEDIYINPSYAARMTVAMDEYVLLVPFENTKAVSETIAAYSRSRVPFYLDSEFDEDWSGYLDKENSDRFLFAAPGFDPDPPKIKLASEFAVEKIDNRLHAVVVVSMGRLPHRILATSEWAGDCAVNSDNPYDTLTFIVPNQVPEKIPIVVTGSAVDRWMRAHRIGPDTLDNTILATVWGNTDYTFFNFIYFAENDRHCRHDIDPELDRLIARTEESGGKLLITGYRYKDALCAYNYARETLPATRVRIDPSLVPLDISFDRRWPAPDSVWFINNFSQAIVEWIDTPQPEEVAGYAVFADRDPVPKAASFDDIAHLQINSEPVVGNMFIISGLEPEIPYYVRIAPVTGDGRFGELSQQLVIETKARRKTTVYEFKSRLGNPSAFDFSEYTEISMRYEFAQNIDLYLGTDAPDEGFGNLVLKSPSIVASKHTIWKTRSAGILFMDIEPLDAPFDVQELTSIAKKHSEPCRIGGRYLIRTPDGYELVIRIESVEGEFPNRHIEIQYLYRLVEDAPVYNWELISP